MPSAEELEDKLRIGEIDLAVLLAAPDTVPKWTSVAAGITLQALLERAPTMSPEDFSDAAWRLLGAQPDTRLEAIHADQRAWIAELLAFWRRRPVHISEEISPSDGMYSGTEPHVYFGVGKLTV